MSTKKTITINPDLFNVGGKSKTKKVKDKKLPVIPQLISPNILKNKLLERIKKHNPTNNKLFIYYSLFSLFI